MIELARDIRDTMLVFVRSLGAFILLFIAILRDVPTTLYSRFGLVVGQVHNRGTLSLVIIRV